MALSKTFKQMLDLGKLKDRVFYTLISEVDVRVTELESAGGSTVKTAYVPASAAGTAVSPAVFMAPAAGTVTSCKFIPDGTVTQNDTNYITLQLKDAAGNGMVTAITSKLTGGVALTVNTAQDFTMDNTHKVMTAGEVCEFSITHTASGQANPGGLLVLEFNPT